MVRELTGPQGIEASTAEMPSEGAAAETGEPSTLPEEEEDPMANPLPGDCTVQASDEASEEIVLATPSLAAEVPAEIVPPEVPVAGSTLAVSTVSATPTQKEPAYIPSSEIERGSGSAPGDDEADFLTRSTVRQFFEAMRSCINFILSGSRSFDFARRFLGNVAENIELVGGLPLAQACMRVVDQLEIDLRKLKSLDEANSIHEAQVILDSLLAAQRQERQEVEMRIAEEVSNLERSQAECQKLIEDSGETELVMQTTELAITNARAAIAKAQAMLAVNEEKLVALKKKLEEQQAARAQAEESQSVHLSRLETLRAQLAEKPCLSEEELRVQAMMEAEKTRQHEMHRLRERIRSLPDRDF